MSNYVTTLKVDDSDYLAKIQKAREELNKTTQAARQANEQTRQETSNRQALVRVTEEQRREMKKLQEEQAKQAKSAKDNSPWKDALREIPMVGRAIDFLEGPLGKLALRYRDIAGAAGLAVGAVALVARQTQMAMALRDKSIIADVSTDRFQSITGAGGAVGADAGQVFQSIGDVRKNQGAALSGQQEQVKAFQQLGVTMDDLRRKGADDIFLQIGKRLGDSSAGAAEFSAALKVLGEGSKTLIPAFQRDFAGLVEEWEKGGGDIKGSTIDTLTRVGDAFRKEWAEIKRVAGPIPANTAALLVNGSRSLLGTVLAGFGDERMLQNMADDLVGVTRAQKAAQAQADQLVRAQANSEAEIAKASQTAREQEQRDLEEINALLEEQKRYEFEGLDALGQRAALQARIKAAQETITMLESGAGGDQKMKLQAENEILAAQLGLKQLDGAEVAKKGSIGSGRSTDALARIGGFRGGRDAAADEVKQLRMSVERSTSASKQLMDEIANAVRALT